jgi:hypothetical protein
MSNKPSIPSWQRAQASAPVSPPPEQEQSSEQQSPPATEAEEPTQVEAQELDTEEQGTESPSLLEQASRFLEDPTIRDAPRDRKITFLESKGVGPDEIEKLLESRIPENASPDISEAGERAWSTACYPRVELEYFKKSANTTMQAPPRPSQPQAPPPPPLQTRDIPPIVTYPEFLAQPTQKPPLITTQRLLSTAYITGGLFATIYGFSKYIVAPMANNLAESRHDFSTHTREQFVELNKRLKDAASVDPATKAKSTISEIGDDVSEADSDPTELFHRDYGTQTSPVLSRRPSSASDANDEPVVRSHENRLKIITSHLLDLESAKSTDTMSSDSLKTKLSDLTTYLNEMSYQNQYYSSGSFYSGSYGLPKSKDGKEDHMEVLKNDIRAVKGVFLSARNFPTGGRSQNTYG